MLKRVYPRLSKGKAVVICSGGLDSTVLLYYVAMFEPLKKIYVLTVRYGQRHETEVAASNLVVRELSERTHILLEHFILDFSDLRLITDRSSLIAVSKTEVPEVPEQTKYYRTLASTVVPNRNAILLSLAVALALNVGAKKVFYGAHKSDRGVYPDCRKEFVEAFEKQARLANATAELQVLAPFINFDKSRIVALGKALKVPFELTWSCYAGKLNQCGRCSSCRERKRAFRQAKVRDPTIYTWS